MSMKNNYLFIAVNVLLVVLVGVIIGLTCADHLFVNPVGISAFVSLLVVLCLPSLIYFFSPMLNLGGKIGAIIFIEAEIILSIIFMVKTDLGVKSYWIAQASILGLFLVGVLVMIALNNDSKKE